eukprot:468119-Prymnesium_polylepis.2
MFHCPEVVVTSSAEYSGYSLLELLEYTPLIRAPVLYSILFGRGRSRPTFRICDQGPFSRSISSEGCPSNTF